MANPKYTPRGGNMADLVGLTPDYFPTPTATQEAAIQQAPVAVPPNAVQDLSQATTLPVADLSPGVSSNTGDAQGYGIFLLEMPLAGVGFGGFLPPGSLCLLTPLGRRSELVAMTEQHSIARDLAALAAKGPTQPLSAAGVPSNMPFGSVLLRPGESVSFGRMVTGLCGVVFNVWETPILSQNTPGVNPPTYPAAALGAGNGVANLFNDFGVLGPTFRPYLRIFSEPHAVPRQVAYTKVPKVTSFVPQSPATGGSPWLWNAGSAGSNPLATANPLALTGNYAFALIPPGTKHVTLGIATTADGVPSLVAGTSAPKIQSITAMAAAGTPVLASAIDVNVWWLFADGVVRRHPGDQWTTTGRGQLSSTHDIESYTVPNNAVGIMPYVTNSTGAVWTNGLPWATVVCTED